MTAKHTQFTVRESKITGLDFFRMVMFDHLMSEQPSLQQHGFSISNDCGKKVSKQGIAKRFNEQAVDFIQTIFKSYFQHQIKQCPLPSKLTERFTSIRVMDSTEFKLPPGMASAFPGYSGDGTKACGQIQFEFDPLTGKVEHLSLESALVSDKTYASERISTVQKGDLLLRDLGYYTLNSYKEIQSREAYYISRLKQQLVIYEPSAKGLRKLTHAAIIKRLKKSRKQYLDLQVYIGADVQYPVRLIANLLDEKAIAHRIKNKKHRKSKLNQADHLACQLNLFVTNIPKGDCTANEIYQLYKIRWQIELIFKTWKSVLKIDKIRTMSIERFRCYLLSKLLWIMLSWEICQLHSPIIWQDSHRIISIYKCFSILKLDASKIKEVLFSAKERILNWLKSCQQNFTLYGLKDERKGRKKLIELLQVNY